MQFPKLFHSQSINDSSGNVDREGRHRVLSFDNMIWRICCFVPMFTYVHVAKAGYTITFRYKFDSHFFRDRGQGENATL